MSKIRQTSKKTNRNVIFSTGVIAVLMIGAYVASYFGFDFSGESLPVSGGSAETTSTSQTDKPSTTDIDAVANKPSTSKNDSVSSGEPSIVSSAQVHIFDMGQADCILIKSPEQNILIDAGENDMGDEVVEYLSQAGVSSIDLLIGTHAHADHIGGMDYVIDKMDVKKILLSSIPKDIVPTTKTYTDLLKSIKNKGLKITTAKPGYVYDLGGEMKLTILGPAIDTDDLNETSIVSRLDYGENSFMFTGDSGKKTEKVILKNGHDLDVDVLSMAHHGSNTSSGDAWLDTLTPELVTISVGADNSYGHPHKEVMKRLNDRSINTYRTDLSGTIVFDMDKEKYSITLSK